MSTYAEKRKPASVLAADGKGAKILIMTSPLKSPEKPRRMGAGSRKPIQSGFRSRRTSELFLCLERKSSYEGESGSGNARELSLESLRAPLRPIEAKSFRKTTKGDNHVYKPNSQLREPRTHRKAYRRFRIPEGNGYCARTGLQEFIPRINSTPINIKQTNPFAATVARG